MLSKKVLCSLSLFLLLVFITLLANPFPIKPNWVFAAPLSACLNLKEDKQINEPFTTPKSALQTIPSSLNIIVLLAEFKDAKHGQSPDEIYNRIFNNVAAYYKEASYGLLSLNFNTTRDWIKISRPFSSYGDLLNFNVAGNLWEQRGRLVTDVVAAADAEIDFKKYDRVMIVIPNVPLIDFAYGSTTPTKAGITVNYVTVGSE